MDEPNKLAPLVDAQDLAGLGAEVSGYQFADELSPASRAAEAD